MWSTLELHLKQIHNHPRPDRTALPALGTLVLLLQPQHAGSSELTGDRPGKNPRGIRGTVDFRVLMTQQHVAVSLSDNRQWVEVTPPGGRWRGWR